MVNKKAIVFVDGNNWYHNVKTVFRKPRVVDVRKVARVVCDKFGLSLIEVRYYNSIPDIEMGEEMYYKHMVFLAGMKQKGLVVSTAHLKKIKVDGKVIRVEKGIDVLIASDMVKLCLLDGVCDVCVLISGDADFLPAMKLIKSHKKEVISVSISRGYSRDLRAGAFRYLVLKKDDLDKCVGSYDGKKD
ncbi:MAG: NYN domain-containing protein [archaeon]